MYSLVQQSDCVQYCLVRADVVASRNGDGWMEAMTKASMLAMTKQILLQIRDSFYRVGWPAPSRKSLFNVQYCIVNAEHGLVLEF